MPQIQSRELICDKSRSRDNCSPDLSRALIRASPSLSCGQDIALKGEQEMPAAYWTLLWAFAWAHGLELGFLSFLHKK